MSDQDTQQKSDFGQILAEFEQDAPAKKEGPAVGDKVSGTVASIGEESAFVDLGSKSEAMVPVAELKDAEGNLTVQVGETIERRSPAPTRRPAPSSCAAKRGQGKKTQEVPAEIRQSMEAGLPVEGPSRGSTRGRRGQVMGLRAFCPLSQLDLRYVEDPTQFVGRSCSSASTAWRESGRARPQPGPSRRALLEAERQNQAAETRETQGRRHLARQNHLAHHLRCLRRPRRHRGDAAR
jgi:small subunit ribosomal protein S1